MKLKEIMFVLENCDDITVDGKYIGDFLVEDIHTSIQRIASNAINKMDIAHIFAIEIHKDANIERCALDCEEWKEMTFDRLVAYNDIVSIDFELIEDYVEDGQEPIVEHYNYYVHWVGDSDYENEAQKSYISNDGNLYIVISDGKNIADYFDLETINDAEYMDFKFEMYNIGNGNGIEE